MTSITFNFKEDQDIFYFVELILDSGLMRIKNYKKLEADFESLRSAHPALEERKRLQNKIGELENKLNDIKSKGDQPININKIDMQFSLEKAQQKLRDAGYVFYKYNKPTAEVLKHRRKRRTRKEMELARGK